MAASEFATFSVWLAQVAVLSMVGGLLQYAGNFFPSTKNQAEKSILLSALMTLSFSVFWLFLPSSLTLQGAFAVVSAGFFGWVLGQVQQRLLFLLMGIMNLSMASAKLLFIFLPGTFGAVTEKYAYAITAGYFIALFGTYLLTRIPKFELQGSPQGVQDATAWSLWMAPLVLSITGALIPQMDIIVLQKWQPEEIFRDFVRASLFYKGIYFLMFIFAQWMLPQQISKVGSKTQKGILTYHFAIAALLGSLAVMFAAPWVEQTILKWDSMPSSAVIFWSCFSISLLTWIFLLIQESCAQKDMKLAALALFAIIGNLIFQMILKLEVVPYFQLSVCIYVVLLVAMIRRLRLRRN